MLNGILEGLAGVLKGLFEITIKKINMFNRSGDTYNIEKVEIKIDVNVTLAEEEVEEITTESQEVSEPCP